jgi:hypothetical protein
LKLLEIINLCYNLNYHTLKNNGEQLMPLKFPYGISNFYKIVTNNYFYVDRTNHIPLIEEAGDQLLFLRPRRFGKSLLLSMLENYYDVAKADEFDKLFGDLAIGKNPTPKHNQYLVMNWDFSLVEPQDNVKAMRQSLHYHINNRIRRFAERYQDYFSYKIQINEESAISSFESALIAVETTKYKLYLLIDEYDNFANEVMMGRGEINPERYKALLSAESSLKTFFRAVKFAASGQGLERVFITGTSPILLSDMTTAYNVAENIYFQPEFNDLCGFKAAEVESVLKKVVVECGLKPEDAKDALVIMQAFYNGYSFSDMSNELVYNPTLALYCLKYLQHHCKFPQQMLDENLTMDLNKLTYLSRLPNGKAVLEQALNGTPPLIQLLLANRFGIEEMLKTSQSNKFIISLLYYLGILTLNGTTELRQLRFKIPNNVVRKLYVEHLFEMLLPQDTEREQVRLLAEEFYQTGDLQPICDFMIQRYFKVFDNRDYKDANELTIKTAFLTALFNDVWYLMDSETPAERGYTDLTMLLRPDFRHTNLRNFILEFKYLKLSEVGYSGEELKNLSMAKLEALEPVKAKLAEAKKQLLNYRTSLELKYDNVFKLHTISVVAVGFDRLVWQKVE